MAAIITGAHGVLAYHNATLSSLQGTRAFGYHGDFHRPLECAFAGLSAFASNSNHAPSEVDQPICWDAGLDLLFRIADAR